MNDLQIFKNSDFGEVRVAEVSGEPVFCLADVCKALGLVAKEVNRRLEDEVVSTHPITDSLGRTQQALFVSEDGLYDVILDSRKPEARKFRKWVTSEVLPSIRRTGGYMSAGADDTPAEIMARALLVAHDTMRRKDERIRSLEAEGREKSEKIGRDAPKVAFADALALSGDTLLVRELAKLLRQNGVNTGGTRLWGWLRSNGYVCRNSCEPTQRAMEQGLFSVVTRTVESGSKAPMVTRTTKVTQKGCQYFMARLMPGVLI